MAVLKGIGVAVKGFGKALKRAASKKAGTIKSVKPATRLSERRKTFESAIKTLDKAKKGASPETQMRMKSRTQPHVKDLSKILSSPAWVLKANIVKDFLIFFLILLTAEFFTMSFEDEFFKL